MAKVQKKIPLIKDREELIEKLEEMRSVEVLAKERYVEDVITFRNFEIKDTIDEIRKDEEVHIKLFTELIEMLKKGTPGKKEGKNS